jgi:hypothetical protein
MADMPAGWSGADVVSQTATLQDEQFIRAVVTRKVFLQLEQGSLIRGLVADMTLDRKWRIISIDGIGHCPIAGFDGAACAATPTLKRHEAFRGLPAMEVTMTFRSSARPISSQTTFSCRRATVVTGSCRR